MSRIRRLDPQTVEQIRAGEVIERPGSVVKELVENAIDAGAQTIRVQIVEGGIREVTVHDDGQGMSPADALLAVQRHTTSKIRRSSDLFGLSTLGFRGEALASIAAVSRLELVSRTADALEGTCIRVAGSEPAESAPVAAGQGTTVRVRHLFFNTPPRRAFRHPPGGRARCRVAARSGRAAARRVRGRNARPQHAAQPDGEGLRRRRSGCDRRRGAVGGPRRGRGRDLRAHRLRWRAPSVPGRPARDARADHRRQLDLEDGQRHRLAHRLGALAAAPDAGDSGRARHARGTGPYAVAEGRGRAARHAAGVLPRSGAGATPTSARYSAARCGPPAFG